MMVTVPLPAPSAPPSLSAPAAPAPPSLQAAPALVVVCPNSISHAAEPIPLQALCQLLLDGGDECGALVGKGGVQLHQAGTGTDLAVRILTWWQQRQQGGGEHITHIVVSSRRGLATCPTLGSSVRVLAGSAPVQHTAQAADSMLRTRYKAYRHSHLQPPKGSWWCESSTAGLCPCSPHLS